MPQWAQVIWIAREYGFADRDSQPFPKTVLTLASCALAGDASTMAAPDNMPRVTPRVTAVLGPTNTGKTYLAIERMLGHRTGMIGFPLRLLARENYDRVVGIVGARNVALVTGEEKIIPPTARYFLCTVESMPLGRLVDFLAIDEVQLAADPERGHIFTDRLLHARGQVETMLLGAETVKSIIRILVPDAEFITRPRFSQLSYTGPAKLTRLKRRSAIVAFSANDVYAIAEQVRQSRGGTAVVLGALSPRTRNSQVELYQNGEVDYLVATDAIGMGLNMDIGHVAFARLKKFDGARNRPLRAQEIAQIAGRAGRHMTDGTFGTLAEMGPLGPEIVEAVENHQFDPVRNVWWRNSALDFRTVQGLLNSLNAPPPKPILRRAYEADDHAALRHLMEDAELAGLASGQEGVRLLWEVCQIPDFRKTMPDMHQRLLAHVFRQLRRLDGRLPVDWVANQLSRLDRVDGDIDTLMARIAHTRTWTYISHRADWLDDAVHWQERTRAIEDRLSDALHEGLTQRFIDRRNAALTRSRGKVGLEATLDSDSGVFIEGERVGWLDGLRFVVDDDASGEMRRLMAVAAHRALQGEISRRIAALLTAQDDAFALDVDGSVSWRGARIGALGRGRDILLPVLHIPPSELLPTHMREQAEARLQRWLEAVAAKPLAALYRLSETILASPARGIAFQLREGLGSLIRARAKAQIAVLQPTDRKALRQAGVRLGAEYIYLPALVKPAAVRLRVILWAVWNETVPIATPLPGLVTVPLDEAAPAGFYAMIGFVACAGRAIRLDIFDRLSVELKRLSRKGAFALPPDIAPLLGLGNDETAAVIIALGYRRAKDGAGFEPRPQRRGGKPAGERNAKPVRQRPRRTTQPVEGSPFAALAALRLPS
ncbi:MAG: ATP-dependent RNA helicase SUPV3L1/SUV3 [Alphaproteobacteria bacterium]